MAKGLGPTLAARRVGSKALCFGLIGILSTIVDLSVFWVSVGQLPILLANMLAWLVAVSGSYVMNCLTTFASVSGRRLTLHSYLAFVASGALGFFANSVTLIALALYIDVLLAKLIATGVSFTLNFSMSHFVVFRERRGKV